jgi:hypothetical protein
MCKTIYIDHRYLPGATDKPLHYTMADKEYWEAIYAGGRGAMNITDLRFDEPTKSNYVGIGVPVPERGTGRFIGAVSALADVSGLFALLNQQQVGRNMRVLLVKGDGTIISAPNVTPALKLKSDEFVAVRDALGTLEGRQTGYVTAVMKGGNRLVVSPRRASRRLEVLSGQKFLGLLEHQSVSR